MEICKLFWKNRRGNLLQFFIGLVIMGALSYAFWSNWEANMTDAGTNLRVRIESDAWLAE